MPHHRLTGRLPDDDNEPAWAEPTDAEAIAFLPPKRMPDMDPDRHDVDPAVHVFDDWPRRTGHGGRFAWANRCRCGKKVPGYTAEDCRVRSDRHMETGW